jgi:hypothetical protein
MAHPPGAGGKGSRGELPHRGQIGFRKPPFFPNELPSHRAAYSDRTAALMAYLAAFAYDKRIAVIPSKMPQELFDLGFERITSFHNGMVDGWAYIVEGKGLIALTFPGMFFSSARRF